MNKCIFTLIILSIFQLGCVYHPSTNKQYEETYKVLYGKNLQEILAYLNIPLDDREKISFIGEPPCSLYSIYLYSEEYKKDIEVKFQNLPPELIFNELELCKWNIENYLEYTPVAIRVVDE